MESFLRRIPKAELHVHLEGTLEPEMMFELAGRNRLKLRFASLQELRRAYDFRDLQSFLKVYYEGAGVLRTERDFYDLAIAYLRRAASDGVRHAELFFDAQMHTARGVPFGAVVDGIDAALGEARERLGMSSGLILCFLRHLSAGSAMQTLTEALAHRDRIVAVGLDSSEIGHPPAKFQEVFDRARGEGLLAVAHAGEEGPADYIRQALELLRVSRIDHGVRIVEDPALAREAAERRIPLTVCPLSNIRLRVFPDLASHNLRELLALGLCVTINSDDPAYFGGYVSDNLVAVQRAFDLTRQEVARLARNSFEASFLTPSEKRRFLAELDAFLAGDSRA